MALSLLSLSSTPPTTGSSSRPLVDALPYIDSEYEEEGMREMVTHLIEEEKKRYRPTKNYLEHLPSLELERFETPMIRATFTNLSSNRSVPPEVLSMKRYELPPPPTGKLTDLQAWQECVDNSYAQLQHQSTRITNLELQLEYGCDAWKNYLEVLTRMVGEAQKELGGIKKSIQEVNWSRKSSQLSTGEQLKQLEASWVGLVSKNYEIERACMELEREIEEEKVRKARDAAMQEDDDEQDDD